MSLKHPQYAHGISDPELIKEAIAFCDEELDAYEGLEYDDDCEVCCQRSNTFIRELAARLERSATPSPAPNLVGWQPIKTAPLDKTAVIIAVPTKDRDDHIVGEAYFDPDCFEGGDWWWAGTANGDYASSPISDCNHHSPEFWQPMPVAPSAEGATDV